MLRCFNRLLFTSCALAASGEVCDDVTSALQYQVSHLQERSSKRVTSDHLQGNMDLALARKGEAELDSSTSRKASRTVAQMENDIAKYEARVDKAKAEFAQQRSILFAEMGAVADEAKALTGEITDLAYEGKQLVQEQTEKAFAKAQLTLRKAEDKLSRLYDDVLLKYADKLENAARRAKANVQEEIDEFKGKMNGLYAKAENFQNDVRGRLHNLQDDFYKIETKLREAYEDKIKSNFEAAKTAYADAADAAMATLSDVAAEAAEKAELALVIAVIPIVLVGEQLEHLGEMVEDVKVKTSEKLSRMKESAHRHLIKAKEHAEVAVGQVQEDVTEFLEKGAQKIESVKVKISDEFDEQKQKAEDFLQDVKMKLDEGVNKLQSAWKKSLDHAAALKAKAENWAKARYEQATVYKHQLRMQLEETATEIEELVVAQTAAAVAVAKMARDDVADKLKRVKSSVSTKVKETKSEIDLKMHELQVEFDQAEANAKHAVAQAKKVVDDFAAAAVAAGKELLEEAKAAVDEAVAIVINLVEDPDDWATGTGNAGECEKAKRYRHDTGSELKKYHASSKESCQEKCQDFVGCAYWTKYQSFDCHLFDDTAVVKIDRSWTNTPYGGPVDCVIND